MIEFKTVAGKTGKQSGIRIYKYNKTFYLLKELLELPECIASYTVLGARLTQGITNPDKCRWVSVHQCMTTKEIYGRPGILTTKKIEPVKNDFIELMLMMPINDSKPKLMRYINE